MAEVYKIIHPVKYFNDHLSQKVRPDGRKFDEFRNIKLNRNSIKTADASAIVRYGNTTVVCGIKLELAKPKAEEPNDGFLITNVEVPPLCSSKFRPGPPSDYAQVTSNLISDILKHSKFIDLKELCIEPDKLAWVLYCDMVCTDNDGSLVDACLTTLIASLKSLTLPSVEYDAETENIVVDADTRKHIKLNGLPVACSFGVYDSDVLLADPDAYEEDMCGGLGAASVICLNGDFLCGIHKFGGKHNLSNELQEKALEIAKRRASVIEDLINICTKGK